ncbi:aldo/keto reductase family oxidoreductase [Microlunatus capsulatus]|uniref:Oxidoreductase n=1 Tax=Microlunatus capsulatus TaxID=99117 RepID=A0ABS4Z329_9ACTN|nr:aldo/keto reductase [Microlunatus capsulatus]MBP2415107.1 putative oxidoreductase [Microlunatus capsulatus]
MTRVHEQPRQQLVYGCMGLGGSWDPTPYDRHDVAVAEAAVGAALEIGIRTFDHADIYRSGKAESVFGEILHGDPGLRDTITVQTKCGIRVGESGLGVHYDLRPASIVERVRASVGRLQVDHVDTLLLHRPDPLARPEQVAEALTSLHAEGLVRSVGVSNMSAAQMAALQRHLDLPLVVNQLELSLAKRDWVESEVLVNGDQAIAHDFPAGTLEHCAQEGVSVQSWGALARGAYSGADLSAASPADRATAELVTALAGTYGTTAEAVVLGWLTKHPAAVSPVVGTTDPARIRACADALAVGDRLTQVDWYRLFATARGQDVP